ncbi:MAG: hypothetical protein IJB48_01725 [Clostridia bacterium]|nr:hypothetical protein [Clostridia bacterium]MBQ3553771.1 hypothetical protein [Clostridia bacterium]
MKKKWYIPVVLFAILMLIYIVNGFFNQQVSYEILRKGNIEEMVPTKGLIIKHETVYQTGAGGTVEVKAADGARVSKGTLLANIYAGSIDPELMAKHERVSKKLDAAHKSQQEAASFSSDVSMLDSEISSKIKDIIINSRKKNMDAVGELKTTLATLVERRAIAGGTKSEERTTVDRLEQARDSLKQQIGNPQSTLVAGHTGIFVSQTDGLESLITPENMEGLLPSRVAELQALDRKNMETPKENSGLLSCKIIENFKYYVAVNVPAKKVEELKKGKQISLRFDELSTDLMKAKVSFISAEEDGQVTVICECNKYIENLLEKRVVNVDFILHRYSGYRISVSALHTQDGVVGVFAKRDGVMRFLPVDILYNTQDIAIVNSADDKKPLKLYDEIITSAAKFEEGAFVQ